MTAVPDGNQRPAPQGSVYYDTSRRKWVGSVSLGRDPQTGKRVRRKVYAADADTCRVRLDELRHGIQPVESWICYVPGCRHRSATEPPVLLCSDHRDLLLMQLMPHRLGRGVHKPLVYFARNGSRFKIGWTTNLKARMGTLTLPLSAVTATIPGGLEVETQMHARFWQSHAVGEWFEATPDLVAYVQQMTAGTREGL